MQNALHAGMFLFIHASMQLSPAPFDRTGLVEQGQGALRPEGAQMRAS
jgi:hypothetical protein